MTWKDSRLALDLRFTAALTAAQTIEASFQKIKAHRNEQPWTPAADGYYLRCYNRPAGNQRFSMGRGFNRVNGVAFVQILVPKKTGDAVMDEVAEAIEPAFDTSGADDFVFEDASQFSAGDLSGQHYVAAFSMAYHFDRLRTAP